MRGVDAHRALEVGKRGDRVAVDSMLVVQRLTGLLLMLYSLTMLPAMVFSLIIDDGATDAFERSAALCMACGVLIWLPVRGKRRELKVSDGFLLTTLFWVVLGLFGGLPLHLSQTAPYVVVCRAQRISRPDLKISRS